MDFLDTPQSGTLFRYTNNNYPVYRCPQRYDVGVGALGPEGSNGHFDYVCFLIWSGAKVQRIRPQATFTYANGRTALVPTPIFCEEDSKTVDGSNIEGGHSHTDALARQHRGGSNYASIDGSVHWFSPRNEPRPVRPDDAWDWAVMTSGNTVVSLGEYDPMPPHSLRWGWFNKR
jgi:hypothetical protein